jgi:hypothetical protein
VSLSPSPPIAVLDSSVLVPRWSRHVLQRLAVQSDPQFIPVWSEWIIAETWRTLASQWLNRTLQADQLEPRSLTQAANNMLRHMLQVMQLVSIRGYAGPLPWPELSDEDDVPIWQTAVIAQAQFVVSQNVRHFPPIMQGRHVFLGIEYLTTLEFVEQILGTNAAALHPGPLILVLCQPGRSSGAIVRSNQTGEVELRGRGMTATDEICKVIIPRQHIGCNHVR